MPIVSRSLGIRGVADVVEFHKVEDGQDGITVRLDNRMGWWQPFPIEYKRGQPKLDDRDAVQLCAQAMALEEMLDISVASGFLYYFQKRRREPIAFSQELRTRVKELATKMHNMMRNGHTPKAQKGKHCSLCSLKDLCHPNLTIFHRPVAEYLARIVNSVVEDD